MAAVTMMDIIVMNVWTSVVWM